MSQEKIFTGGITFKLMDGAWIAEDTALGNAIMVFPGAVLGRAPIPTKAQTREMDKDPLPPLVVGDRCVVGANAVIYRGTSIGNDCLLGDTVCIREKVQIGNSCLIAMGVTINANTIIGSRVKIMDNTHLTSNMVIEDDVFVSVLVTTTNDNSMGREAALNVPTELRKRQGPIIRRFATIGQGACILPGVEIGENAIIGANAVVTRPVPAGVLAMGVPARIVRALREDELRRW